MEGLRVDQPAEYEKLQAQSKRVSELESRVDVLMEALSLAHHKQFGVSLCGVTMTEIGTEVVNKLKIIPTQTIVEQHVYYTYACKSCSEIADEGCETPVVKAPREKNIRNRSLTEKALI